MNTFSTDRWSVESDTDELADAARQWIAEKEESDTDDDSMEYIGLTIDDSDGNKAVLTRNE